MWLEVGCSAGWSVGPAAASARRDDATLSEQSARSRPAEIWPAPALAAASAASAPAPTRKRPREPNASFRRFREFDGRQKRRPSCHCWRAALRRAEQLRKAAATSCWLAAAAAEAGAAARASAAAAAGNGEKGETAAYY